MKPRWIAVTLLIVFIATAGVVLWNRPAASEADSLPKAAATNGIVPFRMEQQWQIRLKLAMAEAAQLPPQIYSTGRVIPTPSNRAVVAPPIGGIIESRTLPRIGQHVTRGEILATLIQTPTAAEAATCTGSTGSPYSNAITATPGLVSYWRVGESSGTAACR